MIFLELAALALLVSLPLAWGLVRGGLWRGRREAALALHRAQLAELERDARLGRILPGELGAARLEIERRLLADAALTEEAGLANPPRRGAGAAAPAALLALALAGAAGLYAWRGRPDLPPAPLAAREREAAALAERDDQMIATLRARLAMMDPKAEHTREGWELLGRAELSRGHVQEASEAWQKALQIRFDPELAAETAETMVEASGGMTPAAQSLFRQALTALPPEAPIRAMIERRLAGS